MTAQPGWHRVADAVARAEAAGIIAGVAVIAPSGARFAHNGDRRFVAASTVKIPIMIELFRRVDAGRDALDQRHTLSDADKATGGGIIKELAPGIAFTIGDLAYLMMAISDNTATNLLIDRVGMEAVNATMRGLGMAQSTLGRPMRGRPVAAGENENWAVPNEYADLVASLLASRAASPAACAAMVGLLEKQTNDRRLARHLPRADRPRWGSKTGSLPGVVNDVGFVMTAAGPVVLAVFTEAVADPHHGEAIVGDIARAALADLA